MSKIHTKHKILKLLLSHKKQEFTIRAISKQINIDYKTVYLNIQQLTKNNLLKTKKIGQTTLCQINQKEFNPDLFQAEFLRREELFKNKDFKVFSSYFQDIKEPFYILLLFGSYASRNQRKGSDIDLMLITDVEKIKRKIKDKISLIPLNIHLLDFTSAEFLSMLKTTDFNVGKEAANNNIILFGIENYYNLTKNA